MGRRILSLVLVGLLLIACIPLGAIQAKATPYTHPNTHVNTGDQRADIIAVALTQVGYYEGSGNDTKYGEWYGLNYHGWCGMFVSWCAEQAGVPQSVLQKTGLSQPSGFGLTPEPEGYIPQSGDLFFSKSYSHVGLVYYVDGDYFYTLEGNTWENGPEGVYCRRRLLSNFVFCSPNYQGGKDHNYVAGYESAHPHKEFYKCSDCGDQYYTGNTTAMDDCTECKQSSCVHNYSTWTKVDDANHCRVCSLCGKQDSKGHNWNSGRVTKEATCKASGSKVQQCTDCSATKNVTIPKTEDHSFGQWEKKDEDSHGRKCSVCGKVESEVHTLPEEWSSDLEDHWYDCEVCGEKVKLEAHTFGETCDSPCEICQYKSEDDHHFREAWSFDEEGHWYPCESCDVQGSYSLHEYSAACDETCDICGYQRVTEHFYAEAWSHDAASHWHECTVCGAQKDLTKHTPGPVSRAGAAEYCTECQVQLASAEEHVHGYDQVSYNEDQHWGTCSCGLILESQPHAWSIQTGTCAVCAAVYREPAADYRDLIPWLAGAGAILLIGMPIAISLCRKKKK